MDGKPREIRSRLQPGHISIRQQWKDTPLHSELLKTFSHTKFHQDPTFDFILPEHSILYLQGSYQLPNVNVECLEGEQKKTTVLIVADCNESTEQDFERIQSDLLEKFLSVIPVSNVMEIPIYLQDLIAIKQQPSPISTVRPDEDFSDEEYSRIIAEMLLSVPQLGPKKASLLMETFKGIQRIAYASIEDLVPIVGVASATRVHRFFNQPIAP